MPAHLRALPARLLGGLCRVMAALHTLLHAKRLCLTSDDLGGLQGAKDFRVDADLHAACQADADLVCKDVEPGEGRVQDCLVSLRAAGFVARLRCRAALHYRVACLRTSQQEISPPAGKCQHGLELWCLQQAGGA